MEVKAIASLAREIVIVTATVLVTYVVPKGVDGMVLKKYQVVPFYQEILSKLQMMISAFSHWWSSRESRIMSVNAVQRLIFVVSVKVTVIVTVTVKRA